MRKILLPIEADSPRRTHAAVEKAARIWRDEPVQICLLAVQARVSNHVAMFFGVQELQQIQQRAGEEDLQVARSLLAAAGIPCTSQVRIGRRAETIAQVAQELGCDRIVMAEDDTSLADRVLGSIAGQVRQLLGSTGDFKVIGC